MARPTPKQSTREVPEDQWVSFFNDFSVQNRGAHARLEMIGVDDVGYEVETENRPFDGVSADIRGDERSVWLSFGTLPGDHLTHGVHNVAAVRWLPPEGDRGAVLDIEDRSGSKTVLTLTWPLEFALPGG